jgi:hypothetical protein
MRFVIPLAAALLTAVAAAQSPTNLIGLTNLNSLLVKQDPSSATCPSRQCTTLIPPTLPGQPSGGTACDGRRHAVWITNGVELRLVDSNSCRDHCNPITLPGTHTASLATGLAYYEPGDLLFVVDARNRFYRFNPITGATGCTLQGGFICDATPIVPVGDQIGGLAIDDVNGLLYYTSSNFLAPAGFSILYVAPMTNPCAPICRIQFRQCGNSILGPIQGAAYDACKRTVWVTDGKQTAGYQVNLANCTMQNIACCLLNLTSGDTYVGLCLRPSESQQVGQSCSGASCPNCPLMVHTTSWAAIGGVVSFDLQNAPAPSQAILALGFGPCQNPGLGLGFLCGPLRIFLGAPAPIFAGAFPVPGGGCNGQLSIRVGVPLNPALCGFVVSSQYIVGCPGGVFQLGVTNCVDTAITST